VSESASLAGRKKTSALATLFGLSFALGVVYAGSEPYLHASDQVLLMQIAGNALLFCVGFWWLHYDSMQHDFERSASLNAGIILAAVVFVPYYFFQTRPEGARARPIAGFLLLIPATALCTMAGMIVMSLVAGGG
jgi:hypothetical protein